MSSFLTFDTTTGKILDLRSVGGCNSAADLLAHAFGAQFGNINAIPYAGNFPVGAKIDLSTVALVADPAYVAPTHYILDTTAWALKPDPASPPPAPAPPPPPPPPSSPPAP